MIAAQNESNFNELLTVFSDSTVQVPWNFVYARDPRQLLPAKYELSDFDDFWLSLFKVRVRFHLTDIPPSRPISRDSIKTLLALHQSRFRAATQDYADKYPDLLPKIECLLNHQVGSTEDWEDCRTKWETMTNDDSILYIFAQQGLGEEVCRPPPCLQRPEWMPSGLPAQSRGFWSAIQATLRDRSSLARSLHYK